MDTVDQIEIKFDRRTYGIVLGTFSFMLNHFGDVVDAAAFFISKEEIADFVSKIKESDTGGEEVVVAMNFNDWVVYGALLSHTSSNIPQTDPGAYEVLEVLWSDVSRLDEYGKAPKGPKVLKPRT